MPGWVIRANPVQDPHRQDMGYWPCQWHRIVLNSHGLLPGTVHQIPNRRTPSPRLLIEVRRQLRAQVKTDSIAWANVLLRITVFFMQPFAAKRHDQLKTRVCVDIGMHLG